MQLIRPPLFNRPSTRGDSHRGGPRSAQTRPRWRGDNVWALPADAPPLAAGPCRGDYVWTGLSPAMAACRASAVRRRVTTGLQQIANPKNNEAIVVKHARGRRRHDPAAAAQDRPLEGADGWWTGLATETATGNSEDTRVRGDSMSDQFVVRWKLIVSNYARSLVDHILR